MTTTDPDIIVMGYQTSAPERAAILAEHIVSEHGWTGGVLSNAYTESHLKALDALYHERDALAHERDWLRQQLRQVRSITTKALEGLEL